MSKTLTMLFIVFLAAAVLATSGCNVLEEEHPEHGPFQPKELACTYVGLDPVVSLDGETLYEYGDKLVGDWESAEPYVKEGQVVGTLIVDWSPGDHFRAVVIANSPHMERALTFSGEEYVASSWQEWDCDFNK